MGPWRPACGGLQALLRSARPGPFTRTMKEKTPGSCRHRAPIRNRQQRYSFVATVENVEVRLVPTVPSTVTAATAIRAAIRPYSIAVAPSSFFKSLVKIANIPGPPLAADRRQHALDFLPNP